MLISVVECLGKAAVKVKAGAADGKAPAGRGQKRAAGDDDKAAKKPKVESATRYNAWSSYD